MKKEYGVVLIILILTYLYLNGWYKYDWFYVFLIFQWISLNNRKKDVFACTVLRIQRFPSILSSPSPPSYVWMYTKKHLTLFALVRYPLYVGTLFLLCILIWSTNKTKDYISLTGRYDGNVCVYNAQLTLESSYQYKSDSVRDKHSNIVWEVSNLHHTIKGHTTIISVHIWIMIVCKIC